MGLSESLATKKAGAASAPRPIAVALPFAHDASGFEYFGSDHHHRYLVAAIHRHFAKGCRCLLVSGAMRPDGELVERFINEQRDVNYRAAMATCRPGTDLGDLVRAFCRQLGLRHEEQSGALWTLLSHVMLEARNGITRVFIVDKAELMDATCLDELLRLTRLDEPNVIPVVLLVGPAGNPALQASCDRLVLASDGKINFERLAVEEVAAFIRYQLNIYAGSDASLFSPAVVADIAAKAAGDAGAVNREARRVLAAAGAVWSVEPHVVEADEEPGAGPPPAALESPTVEELPPAAEEPLLLAEPEPEWEEAAPAAAAVPRAKRVVASWLSVSRKVSELRLRLRAAIRLRLAALADRVARVRIPPMVATGLYAVLILAIGGGLLYALLPDAPRQPPEPVVAEAPVPAPPQDAAEPPAAAPAVAEPALPEIPPPPAMAEVPAAPAPQAPAAPAPQEPAPEAVAAAPATSAPTSAEIPAPPASAAAPAAKDASAAASVEPVAGAPEAPAAAAPAPAESPATPAIAAAPVAQDTPAAASIEPSAGAPATPAAAAPTPSPPDDAAGDAAAGDAASASAAAAAAPAERPVPAPATVAPLPDAPETSVAALEPAAKIPAASSVTGSPAGEADMMVERGDRMLASGDIVSARRFYERGAAAGSGAAACGLGKTYDPLILKQLGARGLKGNVNAAMVWYRRAVAEGSAEAATRLERLHAAYPAY